MKKILAILLIAIMICAMFVFVACDGDKGGQNGQVKPSGDNQNISSGNSQQVPSGGENISSGDVSGGDVSGDNTSDDNTSGDNTSDDNTSDGNTSDDNDDQQPENPDDNDDDQEQPPVQSTRIESIQDLIENYSDIVYTALNDTFLDGAGKSAFGSRAFKAENLVSVSWDLGTSDEINEIKFIAYYADSDTDLTYGISSIRLNETINVKDLAEENITSTINNATASYSKDYTFNYNPTIQEDRKALTNAICDKVFGENQDATRYIVDNGYTGTDSVLGEVNGFTVIEVTENGIQEVSIRIKNASTDEAFIANLENEANYRITSEQSYSLSGNKITQ